MRIVLLLLVDILPLTIDSFVMKLICEELKKPLRLLRLALTTAQYMCSHPAPH